MHRLAQGAADSKHVQHADSMFAGERKNVSARRDIQEVESNHDDVPEILGKALLEHAVCRVGNKTFGHADKTNLSFVSELAHNRHQFGFCEFIILRLNAVK